MPWGRRVGLLLPRATALRQQLHRSPEIAHEEVQTAASVANWLAENAPGLMPLAAGVGGGTGLLFRVDGSLASSDGHPSVLLRAELDGLPLVEASGVPHASTTVGRHHACGHDGHTAMLAAALALLHSHRSEWAGVVFGLFQPAEETGTGAAAVLADKSAMAALAGAGAVGRAFSSKSS